MDVPQGMERLLTAARAEVESASKELAGEREGRVAAEASRSATEDHLACVCQRVGIALPSLRGSTPARANLPGVRKRCIRRGGMPPETAHVRQEAREPLLVTKRPAVSVNSPAVSVNSPAVS
eukprot:1255677-Pyramimonas_sp.AAC.1